MTNLTNTELNVLNNLSRVLHPQVFLGTKIDSIISELGTPPPDDENHFLRVVLGTPKNAVAAKIKLTFSGPVIHGETVAINGADIYEFRADDAQGVSIEGNIPVDISAKADKAAGILTIDIQPISGDKMTIGTKVYTFVPVGTDTADGEISVGSDVDACKLNIVAAINGEDEFNIAHPLVKASEFVVDNMGLTAIAGGVAGNTIATTSSFTAMGNAFGDTTLKTGTDCTAVNGVEALIAAITASDTQGIGAVVDGQNTNIVVLSADVAGELGNEIAVETDASAGAFEESGTALAGGSDGTVSDGYTVMVDDSYVYVTTAANTNTGRNWRRISLGAAF